MSLAQAIKVLAVEQWLEAKLHDTSTRTFPTMRIVQVHLHWPNIYIHQSSRECDSGSG